MNALDYILIGCGIFCLVRGMLRGAVSQIFGIAGIIGGFLVAAHFHEAVAAELGRSFPKFAGMQAVSFILLFFLTWFCVSIAGGWMARLFQRTGLGFLDRLWGGIIGAWKAVILAICIISILTFFLSPRNPFLNRSIMAPYIQQVAAYLVSITPTRLQTLFDEKQKELKRYWLEHQPNAGKPLQRGLTKREIANE